MKKFSKSMIGIGLAVVLVIGVAVYSYYHYNFGSVNEAQEEKELVDVERESIKDYATPEFFLVKMVTPKIDEIVKNKFGEDAKWTCSNIEGLYFYESLNKGMTINKDKDWFEITVDIRITSEKSKDPQDEVLNLKIVPPGSGRNMSDTKIELIKN